MPDIHKRLHKLETEVRYLRQRLNQQRTYLAEHVKGQVKWFNVKKGFGFITRQDTSEDVFIYKHGISKNNPEKLFPSVGDGEIVEFDVIDVPGRTPEAVNVTGPNGVCVQGSKHSPCHPEELAETIFSAVNLNLANASTPEKPGEHEEHCTTVGDQNKMPGLSDIRNCILNAYNILPTCLPDDCCHHLRNKLCTFLLLCQLEQVHDVHLGRSPALRILHVLMTYTDYLFDSADPHGHFRTCASFITLFKQVLTSYWRIRQEKGEDGEPEDMIQAPFCKVTPPEFVLDLIKDANIDPETATSETASKFLKTLNSRCRYFNNGVQEDCEVHGRLLDQLVLMFYCSLDQESMLTPLYICYRRWQLYQNKSTGKPINDFFLAK